MYASAEFLNRWRSGVSNRPFTDLVGMPPPGTTPRGHVGAFKPAVRLYCRRGHFIHDYREWEGPDIAALIPGEPRGTRQLVGTSYTGQSGYFQATWHPDEDWREVPNVLSIDAEQAFSENGIGNVTIVVDDVVLTEQVGTLGLIYHLIKRGFLAPMKGYTRPGLPDEFEQTPWYQVMNRNVELRVDVGYGEDELTTAFKGLIDDTDLNSAPDQITITARDFGQVLADLTFFLENVSAQLQDPVIFADRLSSDEMEAVGSAGPNDASSSLGGHSPSTVSNTSHGDYWLSAAHDKDSQTVEWIQIHLPAGRYRTFAFESVFGGCKIYIGLNAKARAGGLAPTRDGQPTNVGWQTGGARSGIVPGPHGGWPYIHDYANAPTHSTHPHSRLNGEFVVGNDSILRIGVQNMHRWNQDGRYRVGVERLKGIRRTLSAEARTNKWILVDDVTDIVRVILRWAGFKEWIVETAGIRLEAGKNLVVNRGDHYIDIIKKIQDQLGYVFFMGDPSDEDSIGIPTFRQSTAMRNDNAPDFFTGAPRPVQSIKDYQLLTEIQAKLTDAPLGWFIYVRGAQAPHGKGGVSLEGDRMIRFQAAYKPPWATDGRMGGIRKYTVHYDNNLKNMEECQVACYLIALAQALASATAIAQAPGNPTIELDDMFYLVDEGTGLATRVWTANRSWSISTGEEAKFTMSLGGSLVDTHDIVDIKQALQDARRSGLELPPLQIDPAPEPVDA